MHKLTSLVIYILIAVVCLTSLVVVVIQFNNSDIPYPLKALLTFFIPGLILYIQITIFKKMNIIVFGIFIIIYILFLYLYIKENFNWILEYL